MKKELTGDTRVFLVINTTEYNGDGMWSVVSCSFNELEGLGFTEEDKELIGLLDVGSYKTDFDFTGVMVVRVA